jgi:membrane protease YdiL (CAAX protease family)
VNDTPLGALLLTAGVVAAEGVVTWLGPEWAGLSLNVVLVVALLAWAGHRGMSLAELGISSEATVKGLRIGGMLAIQVLTLVLLAALARPSLFAQVETPGTAMELIVVFLRILIMTALAEEFVFRGVLFAAWRRAIEVRGTGRRRFLAWATPTLATGLFFGVWHLGPTRDMLARSGEPIIPSAFVLPLVVTSVAGVLVFGPLREWTGGIGAGVLVHSAVNSAVVVAAFALANWFCPYLGATGC